jgi:hypothetical protein
MASKLSVYQIEATAGPISKLSVYEIEAVAATTPIINAGVDQTVKSKVTVTLTASVTGTSVTYTWTQTGGTTVTLSGSGASRTFTSPTTINGTVLTFSVSAVADSIATTTDTVQIFIKPHQWWVLRGSTWQPFALVVIS